MRCRDCDGYGAHYMVHDAVWQAAWPTYAKDKNWELAEAKMNLGIPLGTPLTADQKAQLRDYGRPSGQLCLPCLEVRLKRPLTIEDFPADLPINHGIVSGFVLAMR